MPSQNTGKEQNNKKCRALVRKAIRSNIKRDSYLLFVRCQEINVVIKGAIFNFLTIELSIPHPKKSHKNRAAYEIKSRQSTQLMSLSRCVLFDWIVHYPDIYGEVFTNQENDPGNKEKKEGDQAESEIAYSITSISHWAEKAKQHGKLIGYSWKDRLTLFNLYLLSFL